MKSFTLADVCIRNVGNFEICKTWRLNLKKKGLHILESILQNYYIDIFLSKVTFVAVSRLFELDLGPPKKLQELDTESYEYWKQLRKEHIWRFNKLHKGKKIWENLTHLFSIEELWYSLILVRKWRCRIDAVQIMINFPHSWSVNHMSCVGLRYSFVSVNTCTNYCVYLSHCLRSDYYRVYKEM